MVRQIYGLMGISLAGFCIAKKGATAEAVAQTKAVTESLTSEQIQLWAKQGLTKRMGS